MDTQERTNGGRSGSVDVTGAPAAAAAVVPAVKRISWGAIFAGSVLAGVIALALQLLGFGIGASTISPQTGPTTELGIGSAIWTVVVSLVAMFVGGWTAARLSPAMRRSDGVLHGLITWGFVSLMMVYLVTSALGNILGGAVGIAGQVLPSATQQMAPQQMQGAQQGVQRQAGEIGEQLQQPEVLSQAKKAVSTSSILGAVALLLGGLFAAIGGAAGTKPIKGTYSESSRHHAASPQA